LEQLQASQDARQYYFLDHPSRSSCLFSHTDLEWK
jgi:hypothetical protein